MYMLSFKRKELTKKDIGLSPGSLVYTGHFTEEKTQIDIISYSETHIEEFKDVSLDRLKEIHSYNVAQLWINITGLTSIELLKEVGKYFELDPLTLEDILSVRQRPKIELITNYLYIVLKMVDSNDKYSDIDLEQVSIITKGSTVITFQERKKDVFDPVRKRLQNAQLAIRSRGSDYLTYALIDTIVDNYFNVLDVLDNHIESIDKKINTSKEDISQQLYSLRSDLMILRKHMYPVRELVNEMNKSDSKIFSPKTSKFLRDLYDHTITINETIESLRELLSDQIAIYHSNMNYRMNETMKVLTIIATIFIPLSFIVGIYGMNFQYMPELSWKYGYLFIWGIILTVGIGLFVFFKKKEWV